MLVKYDLDIAAGIAYARKWAFSRNPDFFDFDPIGGDCTNFVSQCVYASGAVMNYTPDTGWYYLSLNDRAAAWTGVEFFFTFITENKAAGPFGTEVQLRRAAPGDVIQLGSDSGFYHSLFVIDVRGGMPYVASHSFDAFDRPLSSYVFRYARCIKLEGARRYV